MVALTSHFTEKSDDILFPVRIYKLLMINSVKKF